ncbi:MAG: ATP-binding cassette domain-containing protein [Alphaproteobacteria bacterium]|jgi:tungstate transport system ATP-binding protein
MSIDSNLPLSLDDVSFDAGGERHIHGISYDFAAGPRTVILGPNGAGKSLLLRLCHGLLTPSTGIVQSTGRQAMLFQNPIMLRRSAAANIAYALAINGVPARERPARVQMALSRVGLEAFAQRAARALSVGQQQRLALTRAWALEPELLFLDEPTASLDPAATRAIEQAIDDVHNSGAKIIMTTHDLAQARRLADEVLFLHHGRLLEAGAADMFFSRPKSREAAAFLEGELLW